MSILQAVLIGALTQEQDDEKVKLKGEVCTQFSVTFSFKHHTRIPRAFN